MMAAALNSSVSVPSRNFLNAQYQQQEFILKQAMANQSIMVQTGLSNALSLLRLLEEKLSFKMHWGCLNSPQRT